MSKLVDEMERRTDIERQAKKVLADPALVPELLAGLRADKPRVKYGCAKVLRVVSERRPEVLYRHFEVFADLLDHENKILRWEGIFVLSHLARVDSAHKFDAIFRKYFAPIPGPVMITAANVIGGAARIALARPAWADRVAGEVLKVSRGRYGTTECRNVVIGQAIEAFDQLFHLLRDPAPVRRFVQRQLKNTRPATRKKAERFLQRHGPEFK